MNYPLATAATAGTFKIDLYEHWLYEWARGWGDLGRLVKMRALGEHIKQHNTFMFDINDWPPCRCWSCRVGAAWKARHSR